MATELATAYVSLVPSFEGGTKGISKEFDKPAEQAGKRSGRKFGGSFGGAFKALAGAGALFGGAAVLSSALDLALEKADLPGVFRNQFGQGEDAAAASAETAADIYAEGWGDSLGEVGSAVGEVQRQLGTLGETGDVDDLTKSAQALADTFDEDVGGVITSASQLVKTGLAPDMSSALDTMAAGFQAGLDPADDFLDTINEYSVQFQDLGLDAKDSFGLINQGLEAGARNSDLVADALKEFSVRATDGTAVEGFEAIGLSAEDMSSAIAEGGPAAREALDTTLDRLREIEDPAARDAAAFEIFGTQAEGLGDSLYALDPTTATEELGDTAGAADDVAEAMGDSNQQKIDELSRKFNEGLAEALIELEPLFSAMLDVIIPLLPVLVPLAVAIGVVTVATWAFNAALMANPIVWIIAAILALIAIVVLLIVYWDEVVAFLKFAWEKIKADAQTIWGAIADFFIGIGEWIAEQWDRIWTGISNFFSGILSAIVGFVEARVQDVLDIVSWLGSLPGKVAGWFGSVKDSAVDKLEELISWVGGLPDMILDAIGDLGSLLLGVGQDIIQGLLDGIESMVGAVQDKLAGVTDLIPDWKGPAERDKRLLTPVGEMIMESLIPGFDKGLGDVRSSLEGATADIGMSVRPPSSIEADAASSRERPAAESLSVHGPLIAVDSLTVDSDDRVQEIAQELWTRASRADRARGRVLLEGATR